LGGRESKPATLNFSGPDIYTLEATFLSKLFGEADGMTDVGAEKSKNVTDLTDSPSGLE